MPQEAKLEKHEGGMAPAGDGWYILHASEAMWITSDRFSTNCLFEGPRRHFPQIGINIRVIEPGRPACLYHSETTQEDFYVISGECLLLVEGEERRLRAGHFVHCPPGTHHVFIGAGDGPCAILMVGARTPGQGVRYPVSEAAARHGASAEKETTDPREAYGDLRRVPAKPIWPLP